MKENEHEVRRNVSIRRETFIEDIMYAQQENTLDADYISEQLQYYEGN